MDALEFILKDNYLLLLRAISKNDIDSLVQIINDVFYKKYNSEYSKADKDLIKIMDRFRHFLYTERMESLKFYVSVENMDYLSSIPCLWCSFNYPCDRCQEITPFDIFKIDTTTTNRMLYSCRTTTYGNGNHHCLMCFAKKGPNPSKKLTKEGVERARKSKLYKQIFKKS
jgi:hypothetical protein